MFLDKDFQLVHSGTVVFAARFYLPQKYFAIRRAFRQLKLTLETQGDVATARKRLVTSDASVTQNERWCHAEWRL